MEMADIEKQWRYHQAIAQYIRTLIGRVEGGEEVNG